MKEIGLLRGMGLCRRYGRMGLAAREALQAARLYLCTATRTVLENGLALFKVTAPESM